MKEEKFLEILPDNFRHEKSYLIKKNLDDSKALSKLKDSELNKIQNDASLCTFNNLRKIRAIAIFKNELSIPPHEGYLLLHCGISSIKSLSILHPHDLKERIGRLERTLRTKTQTNLTLQTLKDYINKANQICESF